MISFSTLEPNVWYRLVYWTAVGQLGKAAAGIMRRKAEPHEAAVIRQDQEDRLRGEGLVRYCKPTVIAERRRRDPASWGRSSARWSSLTSLAHSVALHSPEPRRGSPRAVKPTGARNRFRGG